MVKLQTIRKPHLSRREQYRADQAMFIKLYLGIAIWAVIFATTARAFDTLSTPKEVKQTQQQEQVTEADEMVWNEYRGSYTPQSVLDEDIAWDKAQKGY